MSMLYPMDEAVKRGLIKPKEKVFFTYTCTVHNCAECPAFNHFNRDDIKRIDANERHRCLIEQRTVKNPDILPCWCPNRGC